MYHDAILVLEGTIADLRAEVARLNAAAEKAAERLVFAVYIYPNYRLDSRGPRGCLADALDQIAPEVMAGVRASDWDAVYHARWGEETIGDGA